MQYTLNPPDFLELLGHPFRWQILSLLSESDMRVFELLQYMGQPQNLVSYHLQKLLKTGLIKERRNPADQREIYYSLDLEHLRSLYWNSGNALHPLLAEAVQNRLADFSQFAPLRVLFICTHNSARSQMAEGLWRQRVGKSDQAFSAGTHPTSLHPLALQVMRERDVDISSQRSKSIAGFDQREFDFVITVCDLARESRPSFPGNPHYIHWSLADPAEAAGSENERLDAFRATARELSQRIDALLAKLSFRHQKTI
jgi:protein-tyrosine-phosphatase